jgi:hypothetical protein
MNLSPPASSRRVAIATVVALLALVGFAAAPPASASSAASTKAKGCAAAVVNDWYTHKDRKVHGHYPLHCYQDALDSLGSDVGDYTNAREAISAAAAAEALRCKSDCGPTNSSGGTGTKKLKPGEKWIEYRNTYDFRGGAETPIDAVPVSSSSPSSVPLPLIVLAALAGVLLLAGAGSYVARRLKADRTAPPAADTTS